MFPCFVYPIILAFYGILILGWLYSFVFFITAIRMKHRLATWIAFVPLSLLTAFFLFCIFDAVWTRLPGTVYRDTFGEKPSADVSAIRSYYSIGADYERTCLQFHADKSTFERISPSRLNELTYDEFIKILPSGVLSPPDWWIKVNSDMTIRLRVDNIQRPYYEELLTYDEDTRLVQYFCDF